MNLLFSYFLILFTSVYSPQTLQKRDFYRVFAEGTLIEVSKTIQTLESTKQTSYTRAYIGALRMKQANLETKTTLKLEYFKQGSAMLDKEIAQNPNNVEFRFLRLAIQEAAPAILGYNTNIATDKKIIQQGYKQLDSFLQDYIKQYTSQSKVLSSKDLL